MEMKPDDRFMERAEEKRAEAEAMSDEELREDIFGAIEDRLDKQELRLFRRDFQQGQDESREEFEARIEAKFDALDEKREQLAEAREMEFSRDELLLCKLESRGPAFQATKQL